MHLFKQTLHAWPSLQLFLLGVRVLKQKHPQLVHILERISDSDVAIQNKIENRDVRILVRFEINKLATLLSGACAEGAAGSFYQLLYLADNLVLNQLKILLHLGQDQIVHILERHFS